MVKYLKNGKKKITVLFNKSSDEHIAPQQKAHTLDKYTKLVNILSNFSNCKNH